MRHVGLIWMGILSIRRRIIALRMRILSCPAILIHIPLVPIIVARLIGILLIPPILIVPLISLRIVLLPLPLRLMTRVLQPFIISVVAHPKKINYTKDKTENNENYSIINQNPLHILLSFPLCRFV
jgi:predicted membrane metal-binding protein